MCADDPVADAEWTAQYENEMQEIRDQEKRMKDQDRLDGVIELSAWYGHSYFYNMRIDYILCFVYTK